MSRGKNYKDDLLSDLRNDPDYADKYLTAARADSREAFLVALRDVAEARKGMMKVAKEAHLNRENLYRALSRDGNPRIDTVDSVLEVLGMEAVFHTKRLAVAVAPSIAQPASPLMEGSSATHVSLTIKTQANQTGGYTSCTSDFHGYQVAVGHSIPMRPLTAGASEQVGLERG